MMRAILLDPDSLLLLVGGMVAVIELTVITIHRPLFGIWLFSASALLTTAGVLRLGSVGAIQLAPLDAASAVLLLATVGILLIRPTPVPKALLLILLLAALALARGIGMFGLQVAANSSRLLAYFVVAALFAYAAREHWSFEDLQRLWKWAAGILMGGAVLFLLRQGLGGVSGNRALNSQQALVVAQAGLILLVSPRLRDRQFAVACFLVVLLSQQRTVWMATITSVLVLILSGSQDRTASTRARRLTILVLCSGLLLLMFGPERLRATVGEASSVSSDSGTFGWRIISGLELSKQIGEKSFLDQLIGQPSGQGFARVVNGQLFSVSPHNMYLAVAIGLGIVGLACLFSLMIRSVRASNSSEQPAQTALIIGLAVYGFGYQLDCIQAFVVLAPLTVVAVRGTRQQPRRAAIV